MNPDKDKVGVVVLEPQQPLLKRLVWLATQIWGDNEVLPRETSKSLAYAEQFLDFQTLVVRASVLRASAQASDCTLSCLAQGTQVIVILDTLNSPLDRHACNLGNLHFLPVQASDQQLRNLLVKCMLRNIANRTLAI